MATLCQATTALRLRDFFRENDSTNEEDDINEASGAEGVEVEALESEEDENSLTENHESDEEEQPFDISLAASHSYMGRHLVTVSGRSVLEAGWEGCVPVIAHHGAVFPGETVPMLLTNTHDADMLEKVINEDRLFGLLCPDGSGSFVSGYGVLCEVFEASKPDEMPPPLTFKARATCRFCFVHMPRQPVPIFLYSRMRPTVVRVLPELRRGDPLRPARLASLDALRDERRGGRLRRLDAALTPWPQFVYDIFDYRRMRQLIVDYFASMALTGAPEDAVSLSFWAASNLPLSTRDRVALFVVDDALLRLHMGVRFISQKSALKCSCGAEIARREHIIAMSSEGVHSNYANLGGYVHDIVTVERATNTRGSGVTAAEFSWFPGYTWTVALCTACSEHVGWRFDAQRRNLRPQQFFGLCRNYVQPRPGADDDDGLEGDDAEDAQRADAREADARGADGGGERALTLAAQLRAARHALSALRYRPA